MSECWLYAGATDRNGYPQLSHMVDGQKRTTMIHRAMYQTECGDIPTGMTLDHKCRVTTCINPEHLEPVSLRVNILRGTSPSAIHAQQTHCINGHEFNKENTQWQTRNGKQERKCRICSRRHIRAWYVRKQISI